MRDLCLSGRPNVRWINRAFLRIVVRFLLEDLLCQDRYELGIRLVGAREMERLNGRFLNHSGSTDVLSFGYAALPGGQGLHGDLAVCVEQAVVQAKRFRTSWQAEVVRYIVHGVLHLMGFEDGSPAGRRIMRREEGRVMRKLECRFPLRNLGGNHKLNA